MGANQENQDEHKLSSEEKFIQEMSKSSFEQDIYICGNYSLNFFENKIIKRLSNPMKPNIKYYDKMGKHKEIPDWHFFFAKKTNNFDEMLENIKLFLNDHEDFEDFDDFCEENKKIRRNGKIVILYFIDENKDNFVNYFTNKKPIFNPPLFIIVGNENENNELKANILKLIKEKKSIIDPNIFKFSNLGENTEKNINNLNYNLIECSSYYNELGDEYKYPKQLRDYNLFDDIVNEIVKSFKSLNILICGRAGTGKSTFINRMLKTTICKSQAGGECSSRIVKYIHRSLPITFYDTPGMATDNIINSIIDLIKKKNGEFGEIQGKIHAVFYLFNVESKRSFTISESKILELLLKDYKIPTYFIATFIRNKEDFEINKNRIIEDYYKVIKNFENSIENQYEKKNIERNIFCVNMIGDNYSETDKLFEKIYNDFKKYIINENITNYNIEEITKHNCFIPRLSKPQDIIPYPINLCKHIQLIYRLIARSISSDEKGSTQLSISFLRILNKIFFKSKLSADTCESMILSMNFTLDEDNKNKNFKSWFPDYYGYKTPAEEEICYLGNKYINQYKDELQGSNKKCLDYINELRKSLNDSIKGLKIISDDFK